MSSADEELLSAFDGHEAEGVRAALDAGADPCSPIRGRRPVDWLLFAGALLFAVAAFVHLLSSRRHQRGD